jgi:uncharacterized membrane protein
VWGRRLQQSLEEKLLLVFPRYTFVKSLTAHMTSDEVDKVMQPVRVDFDDYTQIAFELERNKEGLVILFELERNKEGLVILFLPGSPDPWSGSVVYANPERVKPISADYTSIIRSLRSAGRGSGALLG